MIWPFSQEHEELRHSVRGFLERAASSHPDEAELRFRSLKGSGLVDGLPGDDPLAGVVVAEELGRGAMADVGARYASELPSGHRSLFLAAVAVGAAERATDLACSYAAGRRTFGKPIAKHQVIRHMLADMICLVASTKSLVHEAAVAREETGDAAARAAVSAAWEVVDRGVQVFGGAGYADGSEIERLWRQVAMLRIEQPEATGTRPTFTSGLFGPQHETVRSEARSFVQEVLAPHADRWEEDGAFPREIYESAAGARLFGWKYESSIGGNGVDEVADAVVTEELTSCGSGGVAASLGAHKDLACLYLWRFGTPEQHARWLVPALAGRSIGALAVTEPEAGSDVAAIRTRARRDGASWILDGTKTFITNGAWADVVVVAAKTDPDAGHGGITLFVVEAGSPGYAARRIPMLGWRTSQTGELHFDSVRVDDDHRLGDLGGGFYAIMRNFAWERSVMALAQGASGERLLEEAWRLPPGPNDRLEGLNLRHQAARALAYRALRKMVAGEDALAEVAMSKYMTSETAFAAADELFGRAPQDVRTERALRDLRLGPIGGGTSEIMKEIIGRVVGL